MRRPEPKNNPMHREVKQKEFRGFNGLCHFDLCRNVVLPGRVSVGAERFTTEAQRTQRTNGLGGREAPETNLRVLCASVAISLFRRGGRVGP